MLRFGRGLRIKFWNKEKRYILEGKIRYKVPSIINENAYMVEVITVGPKCWSEIIYEDQIVWVLLKDFDDHDVWVKIEDLYKTFPNGSLIDTYTIYNGFYSPKLNSPKVRSAIGGFKLKLTPKKVIFNGPATIVMWMDGTKTIVKKTENDTDDREKAVMYCILKKICGNKAGMDKYLKQFFKEAESNEEKAD